MTDILSMKPGDFAGMPTSEIKRMMITEITKCSDNDIAKLKDLLFFGSAICHSRQHYLRSLEPRRSVSIKSVMET